MTVLAVAGIVGLLVVFGVFQGGDDGEENVSADRTTTTVKDGETTTTAPGQTTPLSVPPGDTITGDTKCPAADGSTIRATRFAKPPPMCIDPAKTYKARLETDLGDIVIQLEPKTTPKTVNNFVVLARYHYYDGVAFHRVIKDFMAQGGDPAGTGAGPFPGYAFDDENLRRTKYEEGVVAMANSGPNSNGGQFFILFSDAGAKQLIEGAPDKKPHYTRFGKVVDGFDVVKKIEADGADADPSPPAVVHRMKKVTIEES